MKVVLMQNKYKILCIVLFVLNILGVLILLFVFNFNVSRLIKSFVIVNRKYNHSYVKYCLADKDDKCITAKRYDYIRKSSMPDLYIVSKKNKNGIINSKGKTVYFPKYDDIRIYSDLIVLRKGNSYKLYQIIRKKHKLILSVNSETPPCMIAYNLYVITKNGKQMIINEKGCNVLKEDYQQLDIVSFDNLLFKVKKDNKYGIVNIKNEYNVQLIYDELKPSDFSKESYLAKKDGKWGVINYKNEILKDFIYDDMPYKITDDYIILKKYVSKEEIKTIRDKLKQKEEPIKNKEQNKKNKVESTPIKYKVYGDLHVVSVYDDGDNAKRTFEHQLNKVNIMVEVTDKPVTLLLSSYEAVLWTVKAKPGVKIKKIYFTGNHDGDVIPPSKDIPVEKLSDNLYWDDSEVKNIASYFDKKPKTFKYQYGNDYFFVDGKIGLQKDIEN